MVQVCSQMVGNEIRRRMRRGMHRDEQTRVFVCEYALLLTKVHQVTILGNKYYIIHKANHDVEQ